MALRANLIGNRLMNIIIQNPCLIRPVRVVAGGTIRFHYGVVHVLLDKIRPVRLVATYAKCHKIIFKKIFRLVRSVGIMAARTSLFHGVMLEFCFGNRIAHVLVAFKAEFIPCLEKNGFIIGCMRIVALHTIPLHNNLMNALWTLRHNPFMAFAANLVCIFIQQLPMRSRVRIMTLRTFS